MVVAFALVGRATKTRQGFDLPVPAVHFDRLALAEDMRESSLAAGADVHISFIGPDVPAFRILF